MVAQVRKISAFAMNGLFFLAESNYTEYNIDMDNIGIDESDFRILRRQDLIYVDKTEYIYKLISSSGRFFFISRPRRYGKSLFCSTLHAVMAGERELFRGLYIAEKTDYDFEVYPVLHFDFSIMDLNSEGSFLDSFMDAIKSAAKSNKVDIEKSNPASMISRLIDILHERDGKGIVVIIDEYDSALTDVLLSSRPERIEWVREIFNTFYKILKAKSSIIRFLFITGVMRFSSLSIFSAMNNLQDISMDPAVASAFGYTEEELLRYFRDGITEYLEEHPEDSQELFARKIRDYYDGYRFSYKSDSTVYNPVSIGSFFLKGCEFQPFWVSSGNTHLIAELSSRFNIAEAIEKEELSFPVSVFSSFNVAEINGYQMDDISLYLLLYYSGYLTIGDYEDGEIFLRFPNLEVRMSFAVNLSRRYLRKSSQLSAVWIGRFRTACAKGDEGIVMDMISRYFGAFSYELMNVEKERIYQAAFHGIFIMMGLMATAEDRGPRGRADNVVIAGHHIWIFELKVDGNAGDALSQIEDRGYAERYGYIMADRIVHKIGISFSSENGRIGNWVSSDRD